MAVSITQTANPAGVAASSNVATYSSQSIGTEADDRIILVCVGTELTGSTPSSCTIDFGSGDTAMTSATLGTLGALRTQIFRLHVPTGTTATIKVTYSSTNPNTAQNHIAIYSVTGANVVSVGADTSADMDASDPLTTGSTTIPTGGGMLALVASLVDTDAKTWSNLTEDIDEDAGNFRFSTATSTTAGTATRTCTGGTNGEDGVMSWIIFSDNTLPLATGFGTSVTSMPVKMPSAVNSGDLLIALVHVRNAGTWSTVPTGWSTISTLSQAGGGSVGKLDGFYKIADGSEEETTPTWIASTGTTSVFTVIHKRDWHGTTPPEATTASGDSSSANPPSLTPSWGSAEDIWIVVAGHSASSAAAFTAAPTDYGNFQNDGASSGGAAVSLATAERTLTASSEDPGTFTAGGSNRWWASATIAIRPAGGVIVVVKRRRVTVT